MKTFLERLAILVFTGIVAGWVYSFSALLAFAWTFLLTVVGAFFVCLIASLLGWVYIDFPGTVVLPHIGVSAGAYLSGFTALQFLSWKGLAEIEIGWLTLLTVAGISLVFAFLSCFLTRPK